MAIGFSLNRVIECIALRREQDRITEPSGKALGSNLDGGNGGKK